jgi:predicted transcriptional regulator
LAPGKETSEQMHQEVERAAVTRMLDLTDILEVINDGLDQGPFAQEQLVGEMEQLIAHVLAQLGDQLEALIGEEALGEELRNVALVGKELTKEPADQMWNWRAVVEIAWGEAEGEQLPTVIDDQMEF